MPVIKRPGGVSRGFRDAGSSPEITRPRKPRPHPAESGQLGGDSPRQRRGNGMTEAVVRRPGLAPGQVDSHHLAFQVDQRSARVQPGDDGVGPDEIVASRLPSLIESRRRFPPRPWRRGPRSDPRQAPSLPLEVHQNHPRRPVAAVGSRRQSTARRVRCAGRERYGRSRPRDDRRASRSRAAPSITRSLVRMRPLEASTTTPQPARRSHRDNGPECGDTAQRSRTESPAQYGRRQDRTRKAHGTDRNDRGRDLVDGLAETGRKAFGLVVVP